MYEYKCRIVKVIDGDTVDCEIDLGFHIYIIKRVRLLGVDTPEMNSSNEDQRLAARAAKDFVISIQESVTSIKTELDKADKYGRVLGTIFTHKKSVNSMLIEEGHAVPYMIK